jgi:serine/threonine protein kinase
MLFTPRTFGKYHLLERIAVGGMAEIYKAKIFGAEGFEKLMVVKQILPQYAQDPDFVKMFIDEAKIAVSLSHGNIVPIYELGKIDGVYFIAMEYIDGRNLGEILEHSAQHRRAIPIDIALYITMEICNGLDYAHRKSAPDGTPLHIIHRDISPQNILISYDGEVKIVDFGIAKAIYSSQTTKAGVIKGKFGYMSPEQARGQPLDSRTDIFSTGILLFEMLTGSRLFSADSEVQTLENVKMARVPSPSRLSPSIPPMLDKIVFKALAKERGDRYQSADDLQKALAKFLYSQGWEVSQYRLARYMAETFPADSRGHVEGARPAVVSPPGGPGEPRSHAPGVETRDPGSKEPPMTKQKDWNEGPPSDQAPTRKVSVNDLWQRPPAAAPTEKGKGPLPPPAAPARKAGFAGPAELEALLAQGIEENTEPQPAPALHAQPHVRTSPGFELAKVVPEREPTGVIEAAQEVSLDPLLLGNASVPAGTPPLPEPLEEPRPKRSAVVPILVVTIVALIGVITFLIIKYAPTLSPAEKKRRALAEQERLLAERDANAPIYGRVEFFIEPEAVDFYWNGQKHPESPTKHVQITDLDIKQVYRVRLEVPRKPKEKSLMWYPKEFTITTNDWKVVEGLHIFRKHVDMDPTPENTAAIEKAAEAKKAAEDLEKRRKKLGLD